MLRMGIAKAAKLAWQENEDGRRRKRTIVVAGEHEYESDRGLAGEAKGRGYQQGVNFLSSGVGIEEGADGWREGRKAKENGTEYLVKERVSYRV